MARNDFPIFERLQTVYRLPARPVVGPARARSARRDGARRLRWARAAPAARPLAQGGGADSSLSYLKVFTNTAQALLEDRTSAQSGVLTISYLKVFTNTAHPKETTNIAYPKETTPATVRTKIGLLAFLKIGSCTPRTTRRPRSARSCTP